MLAHVSGRSVGLLGCGRWGRNIAKTLASIDALRVIADPAVEALAPFARELGAELVATPEEVFRREDIDAVAIAAPAVDHARLVLAALAAGKHVFVEKPLALTLEDARACAEAAERAGRILMVGHLLQYHPAFIRLVEMVREGAIGELRHIVSNRLNPGAIRTEENALWSFAPHDFSMVLGLTNQQPVDVSALAARVVDPALPDQYAVLMRFSDRLTAQVNVSWVAPQKEHKLTVLGTTGALVFEDTAADPDQKLLHFADYVSHAGGAPAFVKNPPTQVEYSREAPLLREMRCFLDAVAGKPACRTGPDEAIGVLELLQTAERAARAGSH